MIIQLSLAYLVLFFAELCTVKLCVSTCGQWDYIKKLFTLLKQAATTKGVNDFSVV